MFAPVGQLAHKPPQNRKGLSGQERLRDYGPELWKKSIFRWYFLVISPCARIDIPPELLYNLTDQCSICMYLYWRDSYEFH